MQSFETPSVSLFFTYLITIVRAKKISKYSEGGGGEKGVKSIILTHYERPFLGLLLGFAPSGPLYGTSLHFPPMHSSQTEVICASNEIPSSAISVSNHVAQLTRQGSRHSLLLLSPRFVTLKFFFSVPKMCA